MCMYSNCTQVWHWPSKFICKNVANVISGFCWLPLYLLQVVHSLSELFAKFCSLVISSLNSDLDLELLISACQQQSPSLILEAAFDLLDHLPLPNTIEDVYVSWQCYLLGRAYKQFAAQDSLSVLDTKQYLLAWGCSVVWSEVRAKLWYSNCHLILFLSVKDTPFWATIPISQYKVRLVLDYTPPNTSLCSYGNKLLLCTRIKHAFKWRCRKHTAFLVHFASIHNKQDYTTLIISINYKHALGKRDHSTLHGYLLKCPKAVVHCWKTSSQFNAVAHEL